MSTSPKLFNYQVQRIALAGLPRVARISMPIGAGKGGSGMKVSGRR